MSAHVADGSPARRWVCTKDAPMQLGDKGYWTHPDAVMDFEEFGGLSGGGDYEHYTCPNCKKGFYVELPD